MRGSSRSYRDMSTATQEHGSISILGASDMRNRDQVPLFPAAACAVPATQCHRTLRPASLPDQINPSGERARAGGWQWGAITHEMCDFDDIPGGGL